MQTTGRLFDDLAKVASGAVSTFGAVKEEIETRVKERVERLLAEMNLPQAEEVEALRAMAERTRSEQEALLVRVEALEARLAVLEGTAPAAGPGDPGAAVTN